MKIPENRNKAADTDYRNSFPELEHLPFKYTEQEEPTGPATLTETNTAPHQPYYTVNPVNGYLPKVTQPKTSNTFNTIKQRKDMTGFWKTTSTIMLGVFVMLIIVLLAWAAQQFGTTGAILSTILAFIPFILILLTVNWIGKWNPEPFGLRLGAFIYGAAGSILLTFGISMLSDLIIGPPQNMFQAAAIQAPIIEEFAKGLGILLIAFIFKKHINSPVDGMVFIALIAGGFAFTENILYFGRAYVEGNILGLGFTFFLRGIMSPFAHILFSLPMGIIVGHLVTQKKNKLLILLGFIGIYPISVGLHGLWNGASVIAVAPEAWNIFYILIQVPLFIAFIIYALWLRRLEAMNTLRRTTEYAHQGWFTQPEVEAYATWKGRTVASKWGKTQSPTVRKLINQISEDVVALANTRSLIVRSKIKNKQPLFEEETFLLQEISTAKYKLAQIFK